MRNGTIEFFRFVFAICIVLCHTSTFYQICGGGAIGVEFFFIVSGFLLCKKYVDFDKPKISYRNIMKKKVGHIYVEYATSVMLAFILTQIVFFESYESALHGFGIYFENLFFMGGILGFPTDAILNLNWWLITMFIAMMLSLPLLKKASDMYLYILCPICSLVIYGYLSHAYGGLLVVMEYAFGSDFIYAGWLRALADFCMGGISFVVYNILSHMRLSEWKKRILTFLEMFGYIFVVYIGLSSSILRIPNLGFVAVVLLTLSIAISFSEKSYLYDKLQTNICFIGGGQV